MSDGRKLFSVSFAYDWTTVSLGVLAFEEGEARDTALEIAVDEWGQGIREWSDVQVEMLEEAQ